MLTIKINGTDLGLVHKGSMHLARARRQTCARRQVPAARCQSPIR